MLLNINAWRNKYSEYSIVPSIGPPSPLEMMYAGTKVINAPIVCMIRLNNTIGLSKGNVMLKTSEPDSRHPHQQPHTSREKCFEPCQKDQHG